MSVVKLDQTHEALLKEVFTHRRYMGIGVNDPAYTFADESFNGLTYNIFCSNYIRNLNNFHAYGYIKEEKIKALISFYESDEEPAWYYTLYRSMGNNNLLRDVLDRVIRHNEENNRFKFYTLVHARHSKLLRRFHWSKYNNERYGYIDEFIVPAKTKCFYTNHWELLFKRMLLPEDSIVRCNYLKQEYRTVLPIGGNL